MKKVLVTNSFSKYSDEPMELLKSNGFEVVKIQEHILSDEDEVICKYIDDDVVATVNGLEPVTQKTLEAAHGLKFITKHGIGLDNIDLPGCKAHGVAVANTPGANRQAVADLIVGLMLSLARQIPAADRSIKSGEWKGFFGTALYGKTLGIIGMGAIGREVIQRCEGFCMKVVAYDPFWDEEYAAAHNVECCELDDVLRRADYISISLHLTKETHHMIGEREFGLMKPAAYFINCSRGAVADEEAMVRALQNGTIAGAGLDAFTVEPIEADSPLLKLDNVVLTPHIGFYTDEALTSTSLYAAQNIIRYFSGNYIVDGKKPNWLAVLPD